MKKTLVGIKKNRKSLGWSTFVAFASVFSDSAILHDAIGADVSDLLIIKKRIQGKKEMKMIENKFDFCLRST
ncbi:MAG: hypothetical protein GX260_03580 [Tissierellia bacterium]|nr:hypothetical protein [Bacillota bacterium]NLL22843.1 hypothetical protein [Tissierellia bacterium]